METPEKPRDRWCKLQQHLCCHGLTNDMPHRGVPSNLFEPAESTPATTRLDVRPVAYYANVKQKSVGTLTAREAMTIVLALVGFLWLALDLGERVIPVVDCRPSLQPSATGAEKAVDLTEQVTSDREAGQFPAWQIPVTADWKTWQLLALQILVIVVQFGLFTLLGLWILTRRLQSCRGSLCLSLEELSMSLPDGNLHVPWSDLRSAIDAQRNWPRIIFQRRRPLRRTHVRVELNSGLVAGLYVPKDDCAPLAGLMQTLIRCHRHLAAAGTKPAWPVPGCSKD